MAIYNAIMAFTNWMWTFPILALLIGGGSDTCKYDRNRQHHRCRKCDRVRRSRSGFLDVGDRFCRDGIKIF